MKSSSPSLQSPVAMPSATGGGVNRGEADRDRLDLPSCGAQTAHVFRLAFHASLLLLGAACTPPQIENSAASDGCDGGACDGSVLAPDAGSTASHMEGAGGEPCNAAQGRTMETRLRFQQAKGTPTTPCVSEVQARACLDGSWSKWSGTFAAVDCEPVPECEPGTASERTRFEASTVPYGSSCSPQIQTRTCPAGTWGPWQNGFTHPACEVISSCGDGHYDPSHEACDDGGEQDFDGCSRSCKIEAFHVCDSTDGELSHCESCIVRVRPTPSAVEDGKAWSSAYSDLQDALAAAATRVSASGCERAAIWLAQGSYLPSASLDRTALFSLPEGVDLYGGFAGSETTLAQRPQDGVSWLTGDLLGNDSDDEASRADNSFGVLEIIDLQTPSHVEALGIRSAYAEAQGDVLTSCVRVVGSDVLFRYIAVTDCWTPAGGAGLSATDSEVRIKQARFERNWTNSSVAGGGGGARFAGGHAVLRDVSFVGNRSQGDGGALESDAVRVVHCLFEDNEAPRGAAIMGYALPGESLRVSISNSTFRNHRRTGLSWDETGVIEGVASVVNSLITSNELYAFRAGQPGDQDGIYASFCALDDNAGLALHTYPRISNSIIWTRGRGLGTGGVSYSWLDEGIADSTNFVLSPAGYTFASEAGDPGIDKGVASDNHLYVPADATDLDEDGDFGEPIPLDLAGKPRTSGLAPDLGPYEWQVP